MRALFKYELKAAWKSLLIWALAVGGLGLFCILLYESMEDSMAGMAENFASMGAFSEAFGMSTLSIATLKGFFATEVGTIHSLGSGMFAASLASVILSKEEDGHTAEFTFALPISREKITIMKFCSVVLNLLAFTLICGTLYYAGVCVVGEKEFLSDLLKYLPFQFLMNLEIAAICFVISAWSKRNRLGLGISVAMIFYAYDLIARVIPDLKDTLFLSPFSYANAATILSNAELDKMAIGIGGMVIVAGIVMAWLMYTRRDLAS